METDTGQAQKTAATDGAIDLRRPTENDQEALANSRILLKFVAESSTSIPPELAKSIETCRVAAYSEGWSPDISEAFWQAYSTLCDLAKPATIDTIESSLPLITQKRWLGILGPEGPTSLSRRTAERYINIMVLTSMLVLSVELYSWGISQGSQQLGVLLKNGVAQSAALDKSSAALPAPVAIGASAATPGPKGLASAAVPMSVNQAAAQVASDSDLLASDAKIAEISATALLRWTVFTAATSPTPAASCADAGDIYPLCQKKNASTAWADATLAMQDAQQRAQIFSGILNDYILPVLFGLAGSLVYVIRAISAQIKANMFSSASPLRHLLRVWLGPLMGLVVGLFSTVIQLQSVGPFALAFLAGYAVEAVFSMFDNLVKSVPSVKTDSEDPANA